MLGLKRHKARLRAKQLDLLVALIAEFGKKGREEVSFPEILESLEQLNDFLPLKYSFPAPCSYPPELQDHLSSLEYNGFIRRFRIQHDSFLPKAYITLTALGRGHAKNVVVELQTRESTLMEQIRKQVEGVVERSADWWKLWGRREGSPV